MEAAGLVIGVVGLAGIFGRVVDLFGLFTAAQSLEYDADLLITSLNVERVLLIRWAEEIRLIEDDYDKRLDDLHIRMLVIRVLKHMEDLMNDARRLEITYGVYDIQSSQVSTMQLLSRDESSQKSASSFNGFLRDFDNYKSRAIQGFSRHAAFTKRVRWAIRDKDKFMILVNDLKKFRIQLKEIVPPRIELDHISLINVASQKFTSLVAASEGEHSSTRNPDLDTTEGLKLLNSPSMEFTTSPESIADEAWDRLRKRKILSKLHFTNWHGRKQAIEPAHELTLKWTLEHSPEVLNYNNLPQWLEAGRGTYWICGKAGSGKSTLMRYVYEHATTSRILSTWALGTRCYTASYFTFNLGPHEQNTLPGLVRSILYQLLSQRPDLIPKALPNMWNEEKASTFDLELSQNPLRMPSLLHMKQALNTIQNELEIGKHKACMFIDGLDEFVGTHHLDAIAFLQHLTQGTTIKVLFSSRPILECVDAFEGLPSLQLQDLNRNDIRNYVESIIEEHQYMKSLIQRSPFEARSLVSDLVQKSAGVFLWAVLACRFLRRGFADFDNILELRKRINELPSELDDMFAAILDSVEPRHRQQGAKLLKICCTRQQKYPSLTEAEGRMVPKEMYALALSLIGDYDVNPEPFAIMSLEAKRNCCRGIEGRLQSRTAGLLELTRRSDRGSGGWTGGYCFCYEHDKHDVWVDAKIDFLHRSVYEYLLQDHVWELPCLSLPCTGFDPTTALSLGALHLAFQSIKTRWPSMDRVFLHLYEGMLWGCEADSHTSTARDHIFGKVHLLFDLLATLEDQQDRIKASLLSPFVFEYLHGSTVEESHSTLIFAIQGGAVNFVKSHSAVEKLATEHRPQCGCPPLLNRTGSLMVKERDSALAVPNSQMVDLLISMGCVSATVRQ